MTGIDRKAKATMMLAKYVYCPLSPLLDSCKRVVPAKEDNHQSMYGNAVKKEHWPAATLIPLGHIAATWKLQDLEL